MPDEKKLTIYKSGKIRGDKVHYKDGTGCCIWHLFPPKEGEPIDEHEDAGLCWDFSADELEHVKSIIQQLIEATPDEYQPDEEYEKWEEKRKIDEAKWYNKLHDKVEDIGFEFTPFDWRFKGYFITRTADGTSSREKTKTILDRFVGLLVYRVCKGFSLGPFTITW